MHCGNVYRSIYINGIVFSCHLSKNDTSHYKSCQNSGLFKMKPLIGKPCISRKDDSKPGHNLLIRVTYLLT